MNENIAGPSNVDADVAHKPPSSRANLSLMAKYLSAITEVAAPSSRWGLSTGIHTLFQARKREGSRSTQEEEKITLLEQLAAANIDPAVFDVFLTNETNRRLKVKFGTIFLILTFIFTSASYAIVVLDGIFKLNISPAAITALIIETPIQFIGLLYIIARNLFPQPTADQRRDRQAT
jgi:hypothetical protein